MPLSEPAATQKPTRVECRLQRMMMGDAAGPVHRGRGYRLTGSTAGAFRVADQSQHRIGEAGRHHHAFVASVARAASRARAARRRVRARACGVGTTERVKVVVTNQQTETLPRNFYVPVSSAQVVQVCNCTTLRYQVHYDRCTRY